MSTRSTDSRTYKTLLEAVSAFPHRWTRAAVAVAATISGDRSVWQWCEALDELDRILLPLLPRAEATQGGVS